MRIVGDMLAFAFWLTLFVGILLTIGSPDLPEHLYQWVVQ